jgi:hypothetical protein
MARQTRSALAALTALALGAPLACAAPELQALGRHREAAAAAEREAQACARELEGLAVARPAATWSALSQRPVAGLAADQAPELARLGRSEVARILASVQQLHGAVERAAEDGGARRSVPEVGALADRARAVAARLCRASELARAGDAPAALEPQHVARGGR